jgi:hypothetical protein
LNKLDHQRRNISKEEEEEETTMEELKKEIIIGFSQIVRSLLCVRCWTARENLKLVVLVLELLSNRR